MMNSDSDNMMPLMMMMMTMENKQNNNMLPLLIMTMMNKVILILSCVLNDLLSYSRVSVFHISVVVKVQLFSMLRRGPLFQLIPSYDSRHRRRSLCRELAEAGSLHQLGIQLLRAPGNPGIHQPPPGQLQPHILLVHWPGLTQLRRYDVANLNFSFLPNLPALIGQPN